MGKLKLAGTVTCAALTGSFVNYKYQDSRRQALHVTNVPEPEQMVAGVNMFGVTRAVMGMLPRPVREHLLVAANAPAGDSHTLTDVWETNKQNPYVIDKVSIKTLILIVNKL